VYYYEDGCIYEAVHFGELHFDLLGQRHDDAPGLLELTVRTTIGLPPPNDIFSVT
jgi:hypothetical protein